MFQYIKVKIKKNTDYPIPYGLEYSCKGCYRQGKYVILVGNIENNSTMRLKYLADDVTIEIIY